MCVKRGDYDCFYSSYERFKRDFNLSIWEYDKKFPKSLFGVGCHFSNKDQIHASIYAMHNKCYIMSSWGLFMSRRLIRKYIRANFRAEPTNTIKSLR